MADETFAQATMRKIRELEAENARLRRENALLKAARALEEERRRQRQSDDWADALDRYRRRKPYYLCEVAR